MFLECKQGRCSERNIGDSARAIAAHLAVVDGEASGPIIATAENKGCDLIVMASPGRRAVARLLLGSQAVEVLAHSKIPALIVR